MAKRSFMVMVCACLIFGGKKYSGSKDGIMRLSLLFQHFDVSFLSRPTPPRPRHYYLTLKSIVNEEDQDQNTQEANPSYRTESIARKSKDQGGEYQD